VEELQVRAGATIALFGALLSGCSSGGDRDPPPRFGLEGSLSVVMDLGWDECEIDTTSPDEISVRFVRNRKVGMDTPLKIVWAQAGQTLNTPATIDLAEMRPDDPNRQRTLVSRNVLDDKRTVFPRLVRGKMTFFDELRPDSTVKGQFNMTFENGIDFANGRTVFGPFTAKVPP
jgi:hypothetical protein